MPHNENLAILKSQDNDKYLALLFAPKDKKSQLAALFSFHHQISQIPVEVSEQMIGMIKFQWWRDVLEEMRSGKPPRPHPVLTGLQHSNVDLEKLETIINQYEKVLEDKTPPNLAELDNFIDHTYSIILQQAANILETTYSENSCKAYAYNYLARKLNATNPVLAANLIDKSKQLANSRNTVFDIITRHYNNNIHAPRWRLLLKLAFSRAAFI